jgi:hypothetical protein
MASRRGSPVYTGPNSYPDRRLRLAHIRPRVEGLRDDVAIDEAAATSGRARSVGLAGTALEASRCTGRASRRVAGIFSEGSSCIMDRAIGYLAPSLSAIVVGEPARRDREDATSRGRSAAPV